MNSFVLIPTQCADRTLNCCKIHKGERNLHENWSEAQIETETRRACETCGKLYYIPNTCVGGPGSTYPGVYDTVGDCIRQLSKEMF